MHNTRPKKSDKMFIERISNMDAYSSVRKAPVKAGQPHRDKRNDYRRKPKHHKGWE